MNIKMVKSMGKVLYILQMDLNMKESFIKMIYKVLVLTLGQMAGVI